MSISSSKRFVASVLVAALPLTLSPVLAAAPAGATLNGTVLGHDVKTPLAGVTVVVTDAQGHALSSAPTGADGNFAVTGVAPGSTTIALSTADGTFPVAAPVVLAPGQVRGVRVALKGKAEDDDDKDKGGAVVGDGGRGLGAMIAVLVGFVGAGAVALTQDDDETPAASPSNPE